MKRLEGRLQPSWKCGSCTFENPGEMKECRMCNAPKTTANAPKISESENLPNFSQMDSEQQLDMALKMSMAVGQKAAKEKSPVPAAAQPVEQQPIYQPISRPGAGYPMQPGIQVPYGQPVMMQNTQPIPHYQP